MEEKPKGNIPEEIQLLTRTDKSSAAYPPPYADNYPVPPPTGIYHQQGSYIQAPGVSHPPSYRPYPSGGNPVVHDSSVPYAAYGPPRGPYTSQGTVNPSPLQGVYAPGAPITTQPTSWMAIPENVPNCPAGLEYLSVMDQLLVHQEIELLEMMSGLETENKYSIFNKAGQRVYYATEESSFCARNCWGNTRSLEIKIMDNYGNLVINLNRPFACQSCCCPCCLQVMEVSVPLGPVIGTIEQAWTLCYPKLLIKNAGGDTILYIKGPCCTMACGSDVNFKLMSSDGYTEVGQITKRWSGYTQEVATDADNFGISFPMDLDVKMKAVVLGACFLIDMMYYETPPRQRRA